MHAFAFIQDLTVVILIAGVVTILFHRLHQPVVLGYILAGLIIGPHTPPFSLIHDEEIIRTLANLGIIFLLFDLGLHFSLRKLKEVGGTSLIAGCFEIIFMLLIGFELGRFFGWSTMDSIFLGAVLSISSTTIIVMALKELGRSHERFAQLIFGILIIEDILAIVLLTVLSSMALTGTVGPRDVLQTFGRLGLFLTVVLLLGLVVVPKLLGYVRKFQSREMTLITVLGLCFGLSLLAMKLGYSEALGAFLMGAIIAETDALEEVQALVEPLRDLFSAIFFVSVGLLIQPAYLLEYAWPIILITLAVVVGKVLTCSIGALIAGNDPGTSLRVGMGLAQIGEFSFIIAGLGLTLNVTSPFLYPIAVTVSAITTLLTPYLIRSSDHVVQGLSKIAPRGVKTWLNLYLRWVQRLSGPRERSVCAQQMRRSGAIILLNLVLMGGVFVLADYTADFLSGWWKDRPGYLANLGTLSWFVAMLVCLPLVAATFRKLRAVGMIAGEVCLPVGEEPSRGTQVGRMLISNTIILMGSIILGLWVVYLSSTLYPPRSALIGLGIILVLILVLFWRLIIRLYSKFQIPLEEALSRAGPPSEIPPSTQR